MTFKLVQPLFDGSLDIVGDVHGEINPLLTLLKHLGYDSDGIHPHGRRLVFLGDLTDRGPDSPAVIFLVQRLMSLGQAQCVLGNHDLNILLGHRKHDNGWFYGEQFVDEGEAIPQVLATSSTQRQILDLFRSLPLALERADIRIVHACWDDTMINAVRQADDVSALYERHFAIIESSLVGTDIDAVDRGLAHQNRNPVKLLTSGPEERIEVPVLASGKLRYEQRVHWWHDYADTFCVFGHYSLPEHAVRGKSAFCIDYGVGKRWMERRAGLTGGFQFKLAALRWPEGEVVFDDGKVDRVS